MRLDQSLNGIQSIFAIKKETTKFQQRAKVLGQKAADITS